MSPDSGFVERDVSLPQRELLDSLDGRRDGFHVAVEAFHLTGELDLDALHEAVVSVLSRHDALRGVFPQGRHVCRVLGNPRRLVAGLLTVSGGHQDTEEALTTGLRHLGRPFALDRDVPLRLWLGLVDRDNTVAILCGHHLVLDAWSLMLFYEDLTAEYKRIRRCEAARPAPPQYWDALPREQTCSFDDWADMLDRPYVGIRALADHVPEPRGPAATVGRTWDGLGSAVVMAARNVGVTPFVIGCAAVLRALADIVDDPDVLVGCESAGRVGASAVNAVGSFATTLFVGGDLSQYHDLPALLGRIDTVMRGWHRAPRIQWQALLAHHGGKNLDSVRFVFQPTNLGAPAWTLDGLTSRRLPLWDRHDRLTADRPVSVLAGYTATSVVTTVVYRTDAVSDPWAEELLTGFHDHLSGICRAVSEGEVEI